jgi:broad specificity phosphatase PhoE
MKLYLARHGETHSNNKKIIQGQADTELNDVGMQQARNLASILKDENIEKIYSSDLKRAKKTAEIINEQLKVQLITTEMLRELDMGNWEGKPISEIQKIADFEKWMVCPTQLDEIRGGERLIDLKQRIEKFMKDIKNEEGNILIVTHGIALTTFILNILNASMDNIWKLRVNNASLSIVRYLKDFDSWIIEKFNDYNHNIDYFSRDVYNF